MRFSRRRSIYTLLAVAGLLGASGAAFSRLRAQELREETPIAPGMTLLSVSTQSANGPLRYWLVKAQRSNWQLGLEVADSQDVSIKRNVRALAERSGATVAINGGFFAYGGAAVGAVKVKGEWHRLPWKSRTALMWDENRVQIGALSGQCNLIFARDDSSNIVRIAKAALNGFSLPGSHGAMSDGLAVLTPRFAPKYQIREDESCLVVRQNHVAEAGVKGEVAIPPDGFLLVARGASRSIIEAPRRNAVAGTSIHFSVTAQPRELDKFPNILGAGPLLIQKSRVKTTEIEEEFRPDVIARGPRTAIGFDQKGNTLFLVADGRQAASAGLSIPETAQLLQSLGATEAINLDGGSSTQLVINGELINTPSGYDPVNPLRPREVRVTNALVLKAKSD